ncbi:YdeI/OmpD-associated family protein [Glutamicibacter sp. JC586]|uniref:YdeI/OmpD-associated family protein n=1 Tax=Glutamicibacter sp. JC586 TaxID=2590552 RepID=UPI00135A2423|nr:YdeI/OmpD-associated family protein [Glutamicibacter sp. JC586]
MAASKEPFEVQGRIDFINEHRILRLDQESSDFLSSRGQVAVDLLGDFEGHTIVIDPDGRRGHWIDLEAEQAPEINAEQGAIITLAMQPSAQWPETSVPDDLAQALDQASDLDSTWTSLTPMARWEWVRWVGSTKNLDTRQRRVEVSISKLRDGKRRPCCFDLSSCTTPELAKSGKLIE